MMGPSSKISKILLALLFALICFYIFMDVQLYLRIQNYPIDRNYHLQSTSNSNSNYNNNNNNNYNHRHNNVNNASYSTSSLASTTTDVGTALPHAHQQYAANTGVSCNINPLCHVTVKAVLLDHTNHYLFAPLATIFDDIVGFSRSTFITPNMISVFHVGVACVAGKLIASDSLGYRRLGVVFFQVRTFLDDLDGHVARARKNIRGERSEVGTTGYYVDGICDALGCVALLIGMFVFLKNNPPRRGYTPLLPMSDADTKAGKMPEPRIKPSTMKVAKKVLNFTIQLLLSSAAWNRYIAVYQDMLERTDVTPAQYERQNIVFKSTWFFCVAWLWRVVNVHSLTHCVLLSIFCDKMWDFLKLIQYSGYVLLLFAISVSEVHVSAAYNFIFNSTTANNA